MAVRESKRGERVRVSVTRLERLHWGGFGNLVPLRRVEDLVALDFRETEPLGGYLEFREGRRVR